MKTAVQFVGAAQQPFESFMELAKFSLDSYCISWNDMSHILPPTFSFLNPDKSDHDIEEIKSQVETYNQGGKSNKAVDALRRPVTDRCSDAGEFAVFNALWALVQDKVRAPFLTIHHLDLEKIKDHLQQIFPQTQVDFHMQFKEMMREYDFVLIGPRIGIIVIEVKSSAFTKKKDFAAKQKNLPDQILHGVGQLESFDLGFFQTCSGIHVPSEARVRKILFTPNLEKTRFDDWYKNLDEAANEKVGKLLIDSGIIHWFKEDLVNSVHHSLKPALYSRLREMIKISVFQIPHEIYESYGLIISGLASAVILQNKPTVSAERLSTSSAILKEADALETQNPKRRKLGISATDVVQIHSKLVLLTPEQRAALNGPNRQFIIGHPGTGKTIILQAKALQLLKEGKKVLVYTTRSYKGKYLKLFNDHGFDTYEIRENWQWDNTSVLPSRDFVLRVWANESLMKTLEALSKFAKNEKPIRELLTVFDAILIDDTFEGYLLVHGMNYNWRLSSLMQLMDISSTCKFSSKVVWIAADAAHILDPKGVDYRPVEPEKRLWDQLIRGEQGDYFTCSLLQRVMRSSESVIRATYSTEVLKFAGRMPDPGHKIPGFYESVHLCNIPENKMEASLAIWKHAEAAVKKFQEEGFECGHMAVIVGVEIKGVDTCVYLWKEFRKSGISVTKAADHSLSSLVVASWDEVSSFEWPVVIYITVRYATEDEIHAAYARYHACSRAIMKLFEIIAYHRAADGDPAEGSLKTPPLDRRGW